MHFRILQLNQAEAFVRFDGFPRVAVPFSDH